MSVHTGRIKEPWFIAANYLAGTEQEHVSPSGQYVLRTVRYKTGGSGWDMTYGAVYRRTPGAPYLLELVQEISINYPHLPFAWLEHHPSSGRDYLICSEHYWGGITALDLRSYRTTSWMEADGKLRWCWAALTPSPDGTMLAVDGTYWAGTPDVRVYDTRQPMALPYPVLLDTYTHSNEESIVGWDDATHLRLRTYPLDAGGELVLKPGKSEDEDDAYESVDRVVEVRPA